MSNREIVLELVRAGVRPENRPNEVGIYVADGATRPFVVERGWSGPAGHYYEQWSIRRGGREVLHQSEPRQLSVRGLQSVTNFRDPVTHPIELHPGMYELVFVVEGMFMGNVEIEAVALTAAGV